MDNIDRTPVMQVSNPRIKDLTDKTFGRWTVVGFTGSRGGKTHWLCVCECGQKRQIVSGSLVSGNTKSCGCLRHNSKGRPVNPLYGKRYGMLLVVGYAGDARWSCMCDCGEAFEAHGSHLRGSETRSCGCLSRALAASRATTHGKCYSREYSTWCGMKVRCTSPNNKDYPKYGGCGITVCDRWLDSFESFHDDMGDRPEGTSLDRIDNDGNYTPENCRWATPSEQSSNRSTTRLITRADGISRTASAWSLSLGGVTALVYSRMKAGWCTECAITRPVQTGRCVHRTDTRVNNVKEKNHA